MTRKIWAFLLLLIVLLFHEHAIAQPSYNDGKLKREKLGRGVIAIRQDPETVMVSWRYLSSDPINTVFNVYKDGVKINRSPVTESTMFKDKNKGAIASRYEVRPLISGKEQLQQGGSYQLAGDAPIGYLDIPLKKPADGVTPAGDVYTYSPNDASIGDVDGDGEYEIILKWDPSNSHDNSHDGYTGPVYIDCYRLTGEQLWRIDLGKNIRAGAHYTQFMVYDLDSDGKAEVVMRTADGSMDALGKVIGDAQADYREPGTPQGNGTPKYQGRILKGKEYLTVFSGLTGKALQSIDYIPERGNPADWGDERANRSERFLACIAYLDGVHPSVVMCRGYYTRIVLAAFDWNGKELKNRWTFDTNQAGKTYESQGNHNLRVADVDGDGFDEIIYGSCAIDHDGKGLYSTGLGHGDAIHLTQFDPASPKLQVWACHENKKDGSTFRDAATGKIIFQIPDNTDVGRCMAAYSRIRI